MKTPLVALLLLSLALTGCIVGVGGDYDHHGYNGHGWGGHNESEFRDGGSSKDTPMLVGRI
jgi:hypothetical protein